MFHETFFGLFAGYNEILKWEFFFSSGLFVYVCMGVLALINLYQYARVRRYNREYLNLLEREIQQEFFLENPHPANSDMAMVNYLVQSLPLRVEEILAENDVEKINQLKHKIRTEKKLTENYRYKRARSFSFLSESGAIYPFLGILGTLLAVGFAISGKTDVQTSASITQCFGAAVWTTVAGIVLGAIHTLAISLLEPGTQECMKLYDHFVKTAIYDAAMKISQYEQQKNTSGSETHV